MDNSTIPNYNLFLQLLQKKIDKFFDNQKEYIECKEGCGLCCKNAQFPFTEIEFQFLLNGFFKLEEKLQMKIMEKIEQIINDKQTFLTENPEGKFLYDCPFLIDNKCSVYFFRGIVCRTFGLMSFDPNSEEKSKVPFCAFKGLNYSKVIDAETKIVSEDKYLALGFKNEPIAFNIKYKNLLDKEYEDSFGFKFGDAKPLIDWFEEA